MNSKWKTTTIFSFERHGCVRRKRQCNYGLLLRSVQKRITLLLLNIMKYKFVRTKELNVGHVLFLIFEHTPVVCFHFRTIDNEYVASEQFLCLANESILFKHIKKSDNGYLECWEFTSAPFEANKSILFCFYSTSRWS